MRLSPSLLPGCLTRIGESMPPTDLSLVTLRLFGRPIVCDDGKVVVLGRRARGLLAYLALASPGRATRERLFGLFWPDRGEAQARASLRQCLVEVRTAIGDVLAADREWIALRADVLSSDWRDLDAALGTGQPAALAAALTAIGNEPLLDGLEFGDAFDDWLRNCRAALDARLATNVLRGIAQARAARDPGIALALADAWLQRDPSDEAVAAAAIATEMSRQAPAAARRRFRAFAEYLASSGEGPPRVELHAALAEPAAPVPDRASAAVQIATGTELALPTKPSVAVLPFANLSGSDDHDAFADGMVEEISTVLSQFSSLFVIAGLSSLSYRNTTKTTQQMARELGVRYLLDGSVRRAGGKVRIAVKLIDAVVGEQLWAERFDDTLEDVFDLQDRVASAVASTIDSTMSTAEMRRAVTRPTNSPDAYELSLRANAKLTRYDAPSVEEALRFAERAVVLDPNYAWAHATAGFCYATLAINGWSADATAARASALVRVASAVRLAGDDVMALTVAAGALAHIAGQTQAASELIERAVRLNPEKAFVLFWAGFIDIKCERFGRALERLEGAARRDPRSLYRPWHLSGMGMCLFGLRRWDEAVLVLREAAKTLPDNRNLMPDLYLAASYLRTGDHAAARVPLAAVEAQGGIGSLLRFATAPALRTMLEESFAVLRVPAQAA